jgi:hypothetical protein
MPQARFLLGQLVITTNASQTLNAVDVTTAIRRHAAGDWGNVDEHDKAANDQSLAKGSRILSAYTASDGTRFWIISEADRSVTTVLLPEDY